MSELLYALVLGVALGSIYALIASGLNIVFGVMRIVNFAHGGFIILASYCAFWAWKLFGIKPLASLAFVVPAFFALGWVTYYATVPRLLQAEDTEMMSLLVFFGLYIVLETAMSTLWGAETRAIPSPYEHVLPSSVSFAGTTIASTRLLGMAVALVVIAALVWFLYRTYYGKAIRAIIQNREAVQFLGIDTDRVSALAFGIGLTLAGVAGVLLTIIYPSFSPVAGQNYTLIAFAIIVLGGLGDPIGAMVGGIVFAVIEQLTTLVLPLSASPIVAFVLLTVIILLRPGGLFTVQNLRSYAGTVRSSSDS